MTFPVGVAWMIAVWVGLAIFSMARGKPIWGLILACLGILLIKRTGFSFEWFVLVISFCLVAFVDRRHSKTIKKSSNHNRVLVSSTILVGATVLFGGMRYWAANTSSRIEPDGRPIACLGDSLTDFGYPKKLEEFISVPVADFGVNGIKTDDGIEMLPEIFAVNPQAVVLELGGHDYNADKKPRAATRANLIRLIEAFREKKIVVILVEIPRGFISDPYDGVERELANKYDLQLIDDSVIRSFVLNSPIIPPGMWVDSSRHYSNDGLHPNDLGNEHFASVVANALKKVFGDKILK